MSFFHYFTVFSLFFFSTKNDILLQLSPTLTYAKVGQMNAYEVLADRPQTEWTSSVSVRTVGKVCNYFLYLFIY